MGSDEVLFVGVKRRVLALDKASGETIWATPLGGMLAGDAFVNLLLDGDGLFVHTAGKIFCLDPENGRVKWENPLSGQGYGIATLATANSPAGNLSAIVDEISRASRNAGND